MGIFTTSMGVEMLLRWGHFLAGVAWIGLLYYFNFVQMEYFKEADANAKSDVIRKLVPKALWWFRWGAVATVATGIGIFAVRSSGMPTDIYIGALMGIIMFSNVWLIIWPNQRIVIASTEQIASGGDPLPEAADALARAGLASRTNALFSVPMLFFMGASAHYPHAPSFFGILLAIALILAVEYNAAYPYIKQCDKLKNLLGEERFAKLPVGGIIAPISTIKGVIHYGLALGLVLILVLDYF